MLQILPGWIQLLRNRSGRRNQCAGTAGNRRPDWLATAKECRSTIGSYSRRPAFEILEERAMLSVAQDLQAQIQPYQSAINSTLSASTSLPLVGHQIENLQQVTTLLENTLADLQQATQGLADGHHQIAIALTTISHSFAFDLGLDALLQVSAAGDVAGSIMPTLNIGFDVSGTSATLDVAQTNLDLGFSLTLPGFQATMSLNHLLYTHAVDQGTNFAGHLLFGFDAGGGVTPQFSGDAQIRLGLTLSFVDPALGASFNPTFHTDFQLDWGLDTATNTLEIPQIALNNFSLDVDSFTHNFLGDIVTTVQKYTKPLQPFIDTFETPVPIVSAFDSSETIGDLLLQGAGLSPDQQDRFDLMIKVIKAVNTFDLSGSTGGAAINFGDINLTGLSVTAGGELGDSFGFDTSQLQNAIQQIIDSPSLQDLQDTLEDVATYAGVNAQAGFQFPVLEDPGPVIGGILTGQTRDMFTFTTGREHFELAPSIGFGIPDVFGVFLTAGITLDADFSVGYDTAGLIKFAQDPLYQPEDLLHGFYFDNSIDDSGPPIPNVASPRKTAFYLQGFAAVSASAVATVSGGIHGNVAIELVNQDNSPHVYLDTMLQNINGPTSVFNASGQLYASASIELTIPNPIGPNITLFSYELAHQTLLDYDPLPPASETKPVVVIDVTNEHTLQLKTAQMSTVGQVTVQPFHNMSVLIAGQTVVADGIRVDYAGEIDLYIERKNDFTTNYYNLVGLDGPAPDGVSIHIVDPFRVFADEGATDPEPAQTTPGVILVGGRNVTYDYSEAGDGTHATVLLAGGYGSSTLTGGTMEFGNFIPAERLDQAKQHFGDVSGFDSAGQTMINSQIDAAVAPADPTGIIGSTMTASHGGLMFGGPGNNSFFAAGPGAYEMIGGTWVNTFNISPSFGGVPATYQIDGGPFGQSQLIVRVPAGENVTFENSTTVDKYNPAYKALAVQANAGLSATAHGINKVQVVGTPGASVNLGDTSELDIEFALRGGIELTFGGTNEPDIFSVATTGPYHGLVNHFSAPFIGIGGPIDYETFTAPPLGPRLPDPVYSVTRTFGTNGRTQTIPFAVSDALTSSITLNGGGASDTYSINLGVGAFIDVAVNDTDTSSTNALTVATGDGSLLYNSLNFTDTTVELDYYTGSFYYGGGLGYSYFTTSVHYAPTVTFSGNVVPSIQAAIPFQHTTIDRPLASQLVQLSIGGLYTSTLVPVAGQVDIANVGVAWVVTTNPPTRIVRDLITTPPDMQILANAGSLLISSTTDYEISFNVLANSGTLSLAKSGVFSGQADGINILGNTGVLNVNYATSGAAASAQVNVGGALQSLSNVHGTINLAGSYGITIDDRGDGSTPLGWLITTTQTQVGDLTINYEPYGYLYEVFWKTGSSITYRDNIAFSFASYNLNDATTFPYFPFYWSPQSTLVQNSDGESVTLDLSDYFVGQPPAGTTTYGAANLPPGLSANSATGLISGTITYGSYSGSPYSTIVSATNGLYTRQWTLEWDIYNAIGIYIPYFDPLFPQPVNVDETVFVSLDPISIYDSLNRTPVVTVTGLPAGLSFNPETGAISGTILAGASTHGPYEVHVHADDGIETNDIAFPMIVSGIQLTSTPIVRLNHNGDVVDFNLNATTTSGGTLTYSATGLPASITLNTATGQITGTLSANANTQSPYSVEVSYDDGYSTKTNYITWTVLQTGVTDQISFLPIGSQSNMVGDGAFIHAQAGTNLMLPLQFSVQGLPPGLAFSYTPNYFNGYVSAYIFGTIPAAAALNSPYHVTITVTNGLDSASVSFDWQITGPQPPALPGDFDGSGVVDQTDYGIWRSNFGQSVTPYSFGDGNGDGHVDTADYVVWRKHLGQILGGGAAIAVATQESISAAAPLTLASMSISSSLTPLKLPTVSTTAFESHAAIFDEFGSTFLQRAAAQSRKLSARSPLEGPSRLFLNDNLLMMADGQTRLRPQPRHSESETTRFCDESSEDAGVVDQALEGLSVAVDSQRWVL